LTSLLVSAFTLKSRSEDVSDAFAEKTEDTDQVLRLKACAARDTRPTSPEQSKQDETPHARS
jgi:hypothetical protein